jgi:transcriptional regulatory protein RtcR
MATLAPGGRISVEIVDEEIARLRLSWSGPAPEAEDPRLAGLDSFDRVQLAHVIEVCRRCRSLSEAGRVLFSASRGRKTTTNDADRLRKYLGRFGIEWRDL